MRQALAKQIRRIVYGDRPTKDTKYQMLATGQVIADKYRQTYQRVKKQRNSV